MNIWKPALWNTTKTCKCIAKIPFEVCNSDNFAENISLNILILQVLSFVKVGRRRKVIFL